MASHHNTLKTLDELLYDILDREHYRVCNVSSRNDILYVEFARHHWRGPSPVLQDTRARRTSRGEFPKEIARMHEEILHLRDRILLVEAVACYLVEQEEEGVATIPRDELYARLNRVFTSQLGPLQLPRQGEIVTENIGDGIIGIKVRK